MLALFWACIFGVLQYPYPRRLTGIYPPEPTRPDENVASREMLDGFAEKMVLMEAF